MSVKLIHVYIIIKQKLADLIFNSENPKFFENISDQLFFFFYKVKNSIISLKEWMTNQRKITITYIKQVTHYLSGQSVAR